MEDSDHPQILVVDDDQTVRNTIVRMLRKSNYNVISAANGHDGLELFSEEQPDLVITDLRMPGIDGLEVLKRMSATAPDIPVIVVSGQGTITDAVEALRRGAVDYLIKPIEEIAILTHSVDNALQRVKLIEENRRYRENLEEAVRARTRQLETTNKSLLREINSRKKAERELRASEDKFRKLFELSNDAVIIHNFESEILDVNEKACSLLKIDKKSLLELTIDKILPESELATVQQALLKVKEADSVKFESCFIDSSNNVIDVEISSSIIDQKEGVIQGIVRDITERKRSEAALQESEERFRTLFENAPLGYQSLDSAGDFIELNDTWCRVLGYAKSEVLGKNFSDFIHPDFREVFKENFPEFKNAGYILGVEFEMIKKDGTEIIVSFNGKVGKHEDGSFKQTHCILHDITEQKRTEEALRESKEKLNLITNALPALIAYVDADLRYQYVNATYEDWFNISAEEIKGRFVKEILGNFHIESISRQLEKAMSGQTAEYESRIIHKDLGERVNNVILTPHLDTDGTVIGLYVLSSDITARKRAEEELELSRQQLQELTAYIQSAREEERTNIAREIHDELGQVLTALKMDASWLKNKLPLKDGRLIEKISTMINLIDSSIETVQRITSELRPGLLDDLGLTEAIEWMAEDFSDRTGIETELTIELDEDNLSTELTTAIFRIFQETLNNAARHSKASKVSVSLRTVNARIMMEIIDNGIGITEKQKSNPKSFGLIGMRERSRYLGGNITIIGKKGRGTKVTVSIPNINSN